MERVRGPRRVAVFGLAAGVAFILVASTALACTIAEGTTYFTDGRISKSVFRGSRISAYATAARPGIQYKLVIGSNGPHPTHACMVTEFVVNDKIINATPEENPPERFIGSTSGPAGNAVTPALGTYQLCFVDVVDGSTGTSAATITLL